MRHGLSKFSVTAMLREQLALSQARVSQLERENAELKAKIAALEAELKLTRQAYDKTNEEYRNFKEFHIEDVVINESIEFRKGKRTRGEWMMFCPKCHIPTFTDYEPKGETVRCSTNCGWAGMLLEKDGVAVLMAAL